MEKCSKEQEMEGMVVILQKVCPREAVFVLGQISKRGWLAYLRGLPHDYGVLLFDFISGLPCDAFRVSVLDGGS